jgi:hypothetical protein
LVANPTAIFHTAAQVAFQTVVNENIQNNSDVGALMHDCWTFGGIEEAQY